MTDDPCAICGDNPSIYSTKHAVEHAAISEYVSAQGRVSRAGLRRRRQKPQEGRVLDPFCGAFVCRLWSSAHAWVSRSSSSNWGLGSNGTANSVKQVFAVPTELPIRPHSASRSIVTSI